MANDCNYPKPEQEKNESPFKLENLAHPIALSISLVSASAYTFCLGYLDFLGVPENPSLWDAIVFFTKGLLFSVREKVSDVESSQLILVVPLILLALSFKQVAEFISEKSKGCISEENWRKNFYLLGIFVLVFILSKNLDGATNYMWTIVLPPLCTLTILFVAPVVHKKLTLHKVLSIPAILFIIIFSWFIPYQRGYHSAELAEKLPKSYFPRAFDGGDEKSKYGFLLWMGAENSYWLKCDERETLLYGKDKSGHVFYSRQLSGSDKSVLCKRGS